MNFREGWRGHLWEGRFSSFVMDDEYLLAAARYVELNPVRAAIGAVFGAGNPVQRGRTHNTSRT